MHITSENWKDYPNANEIIEKWLVRNDKQEEWFTLFITPENKDSEQAKTLKNEFDSRNIKYVIKEINVLDEPSAEGIVGGDMTVNDVCEVLDKYEVIDNVPYYRGIPVPILDHLADESLKMPNVSFESYGDENQNEMMSLIDSHDDDIVI